MDVPPKKLSELLDLSDGFLKRKGIEDSRTICELLAARLYKCGRGELHRFMDVIPEERLVEALRRGMRRVAQGEPIQYILGQWDFRTLTLKVDPRALIPRPETELLVDLVLQSEIVKTRPKPVIVDVGTGTGCIILSLAKELQDGIFVGLDISPAALSLAQENAASCGLTERVLFAESDGCGEFDPESVDILVSNPPYIPSAVVDKLPAHIRNHEPRSALDGGPDGLAIYRNLLDDAMMVLKTGGGLFFEIGEDQGVAINDLLHESGFSAIRLHKDYAGHDRFVTATLTI
jgi:release factor glutamine methyltransferase